MFARLATCLCLALGTGPALAQSQKVEATVKAGVVVIGTEPHDIVDALYKRLLADLKTDPPGSPFFDPAVRRRYFTKSFDTLITKVLAEADGAVVDFDPITASQDPTLKTVTVKTDLQEAGRAVVSAHFSNQGHPTVVTYDLVREGDAWGIDDIRGKIDKMPWSVRQILKDAETPSPPAPK